MSKKSVLRTSFGVAALVLAGAAHGQASIKEAVEQAFKTNPDILIDSARRTSSEFALERARAGYRPRIDANLGLGYERTNNATTRAAVGGSRSLTRQERGLTLSQMLYDNNATASEVARTAATVDSNAYKLAGTAEQLALKVAETYLEVLRMTELLVLTRENLAAHEKTNDQITLRANSGVGRRADQDQSEARLALARANLLAAEAGQRDAEINFKRQVGSLPQNLGKPGEPPDAVLPTRLEDIIAAGIANSPVRKQAKADIDAAIAQNKAARSQMGPSFSFEAGVSQNDNLSGTPGRNDTTYAMLRMRYNLFNGGGDQARIDETAATVVMAEEIMRRTEVQIDQDSRQTWNAFRSATDRLPALKQHAESSFATRDAYSKQFAIGQRTLLDLLDTENEYFTAQTDLVNGRYTALFARYRILADMSKLLEHLGVNLPKAATPLNPR